MSLLKNQGIFSPIKIVGFLIQKSLSYKNCENSYSKKIIFLNNESQSFYYIM